MATKHSKVPVAPVALLLSIALLMMFALQFTEAQIGVTYGIEENNVPSPQQVVSILKNNGIRLMRIYYPHQEILQALQGSGIQLLLDVQNDIVQSVAQDQSQADRWVHDNVVPYSSFITHLAVGNEVDQNIRQYVGPAMQNVQNALNANGLGGRIKVTTAIGMSLIQNSYPPSSGEFNDLPFMRPIVNFLQQNGSPLMLNVYPYITYVQNKDKVSLDYALFTSPQTVLVDPANGFQYQNLYDALVDSVYAALSKLGASDLNSNGGPHVDVHSSEVGYPSAGGDAASPRNAGTFYNRMVQHAKGGTPRNRRQTPVYLHSAFDEGKKQGDDVERHYGIFDTNGQNKYGLNFN